MKDNDQLTKRMNLFAKLWTILFQKNRVNKYTDVVILYKNNLDWYLETPDHWQQLTTYNNLDQVSISDLQSVLNGVKPR